MTELWRKTHKDDRWLAPENIALITKIDDDKGARNEQELVRKGNLWWTPDMQMYVYYTPTHWRTK